MNFFDLQQRLVAELRERVRSGKVTESGLAREAGVSQPHLHNVLKGKRVFSADKADVILSRLGIDLLDLLDPPDWTPQRRPR